MEYWRLTWFTLACAATATLLVLPVGTGIAWLLARGRFRGRTLVEAAVTLPLVMPPVATGLLLLLLLRRIRVSLAPPRRRQFVRRSRSALVDLHAEVDH